jgi:hypothetical protein
LILYQREIDAVVERLDLCLYPVELLQDSRYHQ